MHGPGIIRWKVFVRNGHMMIGDVAVGIRIIGEAILLSVIKSDGQMNLPQRLIGVILARMPGSQCFERRWCDTGGSAVGARGDRCRLREDVEYGVQRGFVAAADAVERRADYGCVKWTAGSAQVLFEQCDALFFCYKKLCIILVNEIIRGSGHGQ